MSGCRDIRFDILAYASAGVAASKSLKGAGRKVIAILDGEELVARQERARELREVGREKLVRVVKRVARKELVVVAYVVIEPSREVVLIDRLREPEVERGEPAAEIRPVGARELVEERADERVDLNRDGPSGVRGVGQYA